MHKVVKRPKANGWQELSKTCELKGNVDRNDTITPISNPESDECTRKATIWIYKPDGVFGLCNVCYSWCYPCKEEWYRVIKISNRFKGAL